MKKFFSVLSLAILPMISAASFTPYCEGTHVSNSEDAVLQRIVPRFSNQIQCEVGDNCLSKVGDDKGLQKFSITWKQQCGQGQIGDKGRGSTFVCRTKNRNVCCWPLGFKSNRKFVLCSDKILKK